MSFLTSSSRSGIPVLDHPVPASEKSAYVRTMFDSISANFTFSDDLRSSMTDRVARVAQAEPQIERVGIELSRDDNSDENHRFVAKAQIDFGGPAMFTTVAARDPSLAVEFLIAKLEQRLRRQRVPTAQARAATPSTSESSKPADKF